MRRGRWIWFACIALGCSGAPENGLDAGQDMPGIDAGGTSDAGFDAGIDAGIDAGPDLAALCEVPSMLDQYAGYLPPNPYGSFDAAGGCAVHHDVIVLLGCPSNEDGTPSSCQTTRADIGVELMGAGLGDHFIVTGAAVHNAFVEAEALRDLLLARGVSEDHIHLEPLAEHTDENLYYSARIMQAQRWDTALVVSDDPGHLVMTAVCDANCCVELGRLTVFDFALASGESLVGHYVLYPFTPAVSTDECDHIEFFSKAMCVNAGSRRACADDFQL